LRANSFEENFQKHVDCSVIDSYVNRGDHERRYVFPASPEYKEYETMENRRNFLNIKRKMKHPSAFYRGGRSYFHSISHLYFSSSFIFKERKTYFMALVAHKGVKLSFRKSMSQRRK
jgi:hypothetical protein